MAASDNLLERVLASSPSKFGLITENAEQFKFQALLSYVSFDSFGHPILVRHGFRVDHEYFYPASSIKLCGAIAALYKLEHLRMSLGLDISVKTPLAFYPLHEGEPFVDQDETNLFDGVINISREVRKALLVSDNVAFNRLYAFTGQRYINEKMWELGLCTTRIRHRLSMPLSTEQNRFCEPVEIRVPGCPVTFAPKKNADLLQDMKDCRNFALGVGYVLESGELIMKPMDFSEKNCISLLNLQNMMVKLFCPNVKLSGKPCKLPGDYQMLLQEALGDYPSTSSNPSYSEADFPDDHCKLFLPGVCRVRPKDSVCIYNKIGRAYGFTVENAYIFDKERAQGFFLSAVVYTNNNGILNDDDYEYDSIADHLMADLGEMVARAVWKIPSPDNDKVPFSMDCIPSSSWANTKLDILTKETDKKSDSSVGFEKGYVCTNMQGELPIGIDVLHHTYQSSYHTEDCIDDKMKTSVLTAKIVQHYKYIINE